jgi:hypothetical protein
VSPRPISQGLLTRREVVEYLRANDYPLSLSTMNRLCAPACAQGPPMAGVWGGKAFYAPAQAIEWARDRFGGNELRRRRDDYR